MKFQKCFVPEWSSFGGRLLSAKPPAEDHINGVLLGFRVRYRELHYDRLRSFSVRTVNSPASHWADLTGKICFALLFLTLTLSSLTTGIRENKMHFNVIVLPSESFTTRPLAPGIKMHLHVSSFR